MGDANKLCSSEYAEKKTDWCSLGLCHINVSQCRKSEEFRRGVSVPITLHSLQYTVHVLLIDTNNFLTTERSEPHTPILQYRTVLVLDLGLGYNKPSGHCTRYLQSTQLWKFMERLTEQLIFFRDLLIFVRV